MSSISAIRPDAWTRWISPDMQFPGLAKPPVGIVFDSAMDQIDDVLALAMLHGFEGKDQARIAAICISSRDLRAAQF